MSEAETFQQNNIELPDPDDYADFFGTVTFDELKKDGKIVMIKKEAGQDDIDKAPLFGKKQIPVPIQTNPELANPAWSVIEAPDGNLFFVKFATYLDSYQRRGKVESWKDITKIQDLQRRDPNGVTHMTELTSFLEPLRTADAGSKLLEFLNIDTPKTRYHVIDGVPCEVSNYLPGSDVYQHELVFSNVSEIRTQQQEQLVKALVFYFLTENAFDNYQFILYNDKHFLIDFDLSYQRFKNRNQDTLDKSTGMIYQKKRFVPIPDSKTLKKNLQNFLIQDNTNLASAQKAGLISYLKTNKDFNDLSKMTDHELAETIGLDLDLETDKYIIDNLLARINVLSEIANNLKDPAEKARSSSD